MKPFLNRTGLTQKQTEELSSRPSEASGEIFDSNSFQLGVWSSWFSGNFRKSYRNTNRIKTSTFLLLLSISLLFGLGCTDESQTSGEDDNHVMPASQTETKSGLAAYDENGDGIVYQDGMHPQIVQDEAGICPICHMDLTPVSIDGQEEGVVKIDPTTMQNIGVRTAPVVVEALGQSLRTTGRFMMDEQGQYTVSLKVGGWIEKLYADYEGRMVRKGQPLLELYSPELVSTQEEYLLAYRNAQRFSEAPDAQRLLDATHRRLAYWDLTDAQIRKLEETGRPQRTLTFYARASGEVMNKQVTEGQHIVAGQKLMDLADVSKIWLIADIYEQDLGWVKTGMPATVELPYQANQTLQGQVDHIYNMLDTETRTAQARIVFPNKHRMPLKPGMYATVHLAGTQTSPLPVVPDEAILYTGENAVVILALGEGRFSPVTVKTGIQSEGKVQILEGLQGGEMVVTSAQFLIDSEARLQSAIGAMVAGTHQHAGTDNAGTDNAGTLNLKTMEIDVEAVDVNGDRKVYLCVDAPHLLADEAGALSECPSTPEQVSVGAAQAILHEAGYTITPLDPRNADLNGDGIIYQSPMHWGVIMDEPGNCEICNMKLDRRTLEESRQKLREKGYVVR